MMKIEELGAIIKSLIISNQHSITIFELEKEFRENVGHSIPIYHYRNIHDLLKNGLNDAVTVYGVGSQAVVRAVLNSKTQHIHDLVSEQKPAQNKRRPGRRRLPGKTNFSRYSNNVPSQYVKHQQPMRSYNQTAWQSPALTSLWFQPSVNTAPNPYCYGQSLLGNPPTWQAQSHYGQVSWLPRNNNQAGFNARYEHSAKFTKIANENVNVKQPFKPLQHYDEKGSQNMSHIIASSDSGNHSLSKEEIKSSVNFFTNCGSADEAKIHEKKQQISLRNADEALSGKVLNRHMLFKQRLTQQSENFKDSFESVFADCETNFEEFEEDLSTSSGEKDLNKKALNDVCDSETLRYAHGDEIQNGLEDYNENVETKTTDESDNNTLNDMDSLLPMLIFSSEAKFSDSAQDSDDAAIPDFAITNRVFSMDFPADTVQFGTKIEPFQMPDDIQVDSIISIYISEIHSAYRFWFHYDFDGLDELMYNIELFYAQDAVADCYKLLPEQIQCGQICAALYNNAWHRAEILSNVVGGKVKVYYLDYGTVGDVPPDDLMYLNAEFARDRAFACRGSLAEITPIYLHWSTESTIAFLGLVKCRKVHAQIAEINAESNVYYLQIVDNHTENVIHINRELINMKHATKCFEWQKSKLTGTPRLRHRREIYPPFEMLEDGNYPTFFEIYAMEVNGINYEAMTDKMIYHVSININDLGNTSFMLLSNNPFKEDILNQLKEEEREKNNFGTS